MFRNSLTKNPVTCKNPNFNQNQKKKKKIKKGKKTFDLAQWPIKKIHFFREMKPRNLSPFTRDQYARFFSPSPPLFLFFTLVRCRAISIVGLAGLISYRLIECPSGQDPL